jgi:FHS family glucose/mannose:H+ symporter-like MFS transporter
MTSKLFSIPRTYWALFFAYSCMCALGLSDNIRGPLFPELITFFGLTNSMGSLTFALASCAALLGTISSSYVLKKVHLDKLLTFSMLFMGIGLLAMALAPSFIWYAVGAIFFGYSLGTTAVSQNFLINETIELRLRTKALSGLHSLYGFSSLLAPYLASQAPMWFLKDGSWAFLADWRSSFYLTSFFCFTLFVVLMIFKAKPAFEYTFPPASPLPAGSKFRNKKALIMLGVFFSSYVGAEILISTRLALYMRSYFQMNLEQSSQYVTYFFIFLLIGRILFTLKSFKMDIKRQMNFSLALSLLFLLLGLYLHPFFLALVGLAMAPFYPLAIVYISEISGVYKRKYLTFVMSIQSLLVIFMHLGVGYITDLYGLFSAFGVGVVLLVFSIVCLNKHPRIQI